MAEAVAGDRIQVREGAAVWREVAGETVVLVLQSSLYLGVNEAGSVLWPAMVEGTTADQLAGALQARFQLTDEQARADVAAFVAACRDQGLLEPA